ncbi:MAG: hypothetical protein WCO09_02760 [bacterium]
MKHCTKNIKTIISKTMKERLVELFKSGLGTEELLLSILSLAKTPTDPKAKYHEGNPNQELSALRAVFKNIGELNEDEVSITPQLFFKLVSEMEVRALMAATASASMMSAGALGGCGAGMF